MAERPVDWKIESHTKGRKMELKRILFEKILNKVQKPGRYTGKELNETVKVEDKNNREKINCVEVKKRSC